MLGFLLEPSYIKLKSEFDQQQKRFESWQKKKPDEPFEEDMQEEPLHWQRRVL